MTAEVTKLRNRPEIVKLDGYERTYAIHKYASRTDAIAASGAVSMPYILRDCIRELAEARPTWEFFVCATSPLSGAPANTTTYLGKEVRVVDGDYKIGELEYGYTRGRYSIILTSDDIRYALERGHYMSSSKLSKAKKIALKYFKGPSDHDIESELLTARYRGVDSYRTQANSFLQTCSPEEVYGVLQSIEGLVDEGMRQTALAAAERVVQFYNCCLVREGRDGFVMSYCNDSAAAELIRCAELPEDICTKYTMLKMSGAEYIPNIGATLKDNVFAVFLDKEAIS